MSWFFVKTNHMVYPQFYLWYPQSILCFCAHSNNIGAYFVGTLVIHIEWHPGFIVLVVYLVNIFWLSHYQKGTGNVSPLKICDNLSVGTYWLGQIISYYPIVKVVVSLWLKLSLSVLPILIIYCAGDSLLSVFFRRQTISYLMLSPSATEIYNRT